MMDSVIAKSEEYQAFRSSVPLKCISTGGAEPKEWQLYDVGPRSITCPIVFLPPLSGSANVFFKQLLSLSSRGFRVIAVSYPVYWSVDEFCMGFMKLLDELGLDRVHLFGSFLGAFLAQKFAEKTYRHSRVASLILCQAFVDTRIYKKVTSSSFYWMVPGVVLKNMVLQGFVNHPSCSQDVSDSLDFMVEQLSGLSRDQLASRLTLSSAGCRVQSSWLHELPITIMYTLDASSLSEQARGETRVSYPHARLADLKSGGNFPFITRADEVDVFLQVHIRQFLGTSQSPSTATIQQVTAPPSTVT